MNYHKHYELLIQKYGSMTKPKEYAERHHIVPKCLGGTDEISNLIYLSAEAHYVAHQLLVKMNPGHYGLAHAAVMMTVDKNGERVNNKLYKWLKIKSSELRSIKFKGVKPHENAFFALSKKLKGVPLSQDRKNRLRDSKKGHNNPMYGKTMTETEKLEHSNRMKIARGSEEQRKIQSELAKKNWDNPRYVEIMKTAHTGRKNTEETKIRMSESNKKVWDNRTLEQREEFSRKLKEGWAKRKLKQI